MNDWRKPCEHGRYEPHQQGPVGDPWYCTKPSPVTAADLEGLGEKDWVCDYNSKVTSLPMAICRAGSDLHRACGWWLLIPIPEPQPATEGT